MTDTDPRNSNPNAAGPQGLRHDHLTQKVFEALGLELAEYASNREFKVSARQNTDRARREAAIERDKAILELREEAARLTLAAADHLVRAAMNDALHEGLVERYLGRLDGVKKP